MWLINRILLLFFLVITLPSCEDNIGSDPVFTENAREILDIEKGMKLIDRQISREPADPENYFKKSILLLQSGRHQEARQYLDEAINRDVLNPTYQVLYCRILLEEGRISTARYETKKLLKSGIENATIYEILSETYILDNLDSLGLQSINRAIAMNPSNPNLYLKRGKILEELGRNEEAVASYEMSIEKGKNFEAFNNLIDIYLENDSLNKASQLISLALINYPDNYELSLRSLRLKLSSDSPVDSVKPDFLRIMDDFPAQKHELAALLSRGYLKEYKTDSAQKYAGWSLAADSLYFPAHMVMAEISERRNYNYRALNQYNSILEIDSTYMPAKNEKARLLRKIAYLQKLEKEMEELKKFQSIQPLKIKDD
jgi:tetratricopeptide (TPR) repeat protein